MTLWVLRANGRDVEMPSGCERAGAFRHASEWATELDGPVQVLLDEGDGHLRHVGEVRSWQELAREREAERLLRAASAICPVNRATSGHRDAGDPPCRLCTETARTVLLAARAG